MKLTNDLIDLAPPNNLAIEKELIAALFIDDRCEHAFDRLERLDFHDPFHGWLFVELQRAWRQDVPFQSSGELIELASSRDWNGQMKNISHSTDVLHDITLLIRDVSCSRYLPNGSASNIPYYCQVLRNLRRRRAAMRLSVELLVKAHDSTIDGAEWIQYADEQIRRIEAIEDMTEIPKSDVAVATT